jgi:hypothetical protein
MTSKVPPSLATAVVSLHCDVQPDDRPVAGALLTPVTRTAEPSKPAADRASANPNVRVEEGSR